MADLEAEKALAARRAVEEVQDGMLVGLGTGSTAAYAIREIAARVAGGLRIEAVATSSGSETLARSLGIPIVDASAVARLDLAIDGADEIDASLRAIKGGGGALLREKIVASAADRMIAIVDSNKFVAQLGRFPLAMETLPFALAWVMRALSDLCAVATIRQRDGANYLTDQGNYILDSRFGSIPDPEGLAAHLGRIPGLLEHGLFLKEIDELVVGRGDQVEVHRRPTGR